MSYHVNLSGATGSVSQSVVLADVTRLARMSAFLQKKKKKKDPRLSLNNQRGNKMVTIFFFFFYMLLRLQDPHVHSPAGVQPQWRIIQHKTCKKVQK